MSKPPTISIAIGFEIIALLITSSLSKWASYRGFHHINFITPELPDIGHQFLPLSSDAPFLADFIGFALLLSLVALYLITIPTASIRHFIQAFCFIHAPLLLLRISLVASTVLPSPVPECRDMDRYKTCTTCQDISDFYPSLTTRSHVQWSHDDESCLLQLLANCPSPKHLQSHYQHRIYLWYCFINSRTAALHSGYPCGVLSNSCSRLHSTKEII